MLPQLEAARPRLRSLALYRFVGLGVPFLFTAVVLVTSLPEAIDVYSTRVPGGDFDYLLDAGRVITSDQPEALYDRGMDPNRWLQDHGFSFPSWYPYPPLVAMLTAPVASLSQATAFDLWKLAIALSTGVIALAAAGAFRSWAWRIAILTALVCWQPILLNVRIGQTGAFVAALTAATFVVFLKNRNLGGAALGLLALKPTATLPAIIGVFPHRLGVWARFSLVAAALVFVPFLWLGAGPLRDWMDILSNRSVQDLGGGHFYNQGVTSILGIDSRLVPFVLVGVLSAVVLIAHRIHGGLGIETSLAFAVFCGLLLNPHSLLYDWGVAFVGIFLIRRSSALGPLSTDFGAGLLAISLFAAGQLSWSETYRDDLLRPLTLWCAAVAGGLALRALLPDFLSWRRPRPARHAGM